MKFFKTVSPLDDYSREKVFSKSQEEFEKIMHCWLDQDKSNFDATLATVLHYYWHKAGCPFYRLYPGLVEALLRIDTAKFSTLDLRLPFPAISFELSDQTDVTLGGQKILNFILCDEPDSHSGAVLFETEIGGIDNHGYLGIPFKNLSDLVLQHSDDVCRDALKLIVGMAVIGKNPDFLRPIVLQKDKEKFSKSGDAKFVEKARRYGVFGFDVGADIPTLSDVAKMRAENIDAEKRGKVAPHIRCAHAQLYWTGKGRSVPEIRLVRQALVNWGKVETLPHGFYNDEK